MYMTFPDANPLNLGRLKTEIERLEILLAQDSETLLEDRHTMIATQVAVAATEATLAALRQTLKLLDSSSTEKSLSQPNRRVLVDAETQSTKRSPMDMVDPKFKGMMLSQIIDQVLIEAGCALTTNELTRQIYQTSSDEEFCRARNSLSAELRSGVRRNLPTWEKIGRNAYVRI